MGRIKRSLHFGGEPAKPAPSKPEPAPRCPRCGEALAEVWNKGHKALTGYRCPMNMPYMGCGWEGPVAATLKGAKPAPPIPVDHHAVEGRAWPVKVLKRERETYQRQVDYLENNPRNARTWASDEAVLAFSQAAVTRIDELLAFAKGTK